MRTPYFFTATHLHHLHATMPCHTATPQPSPCSRLHPVPPALHPAPAGDDLPPKVPHSATHPAGAGDGHCAAEVGCAVWDVLFGHFRHLRGVPPVTVGIFSHELAAADFSPAALRVGHPMLRHLEVQGRVARVQPPYGEPLSYELESGRLLPHCAAAGSRLQLLSCAPAGGAPTPMLVEQTAGGASLYYSLSGGYPLFLRTAEHALLSAEEFSAALQPVRGQGGSLRQLRSATAGLLHVRVLTPHAFLISLFAPQQVGSRGDDGLFSCCGAPYLTLGLSGVPGYAMDLILSSPTAPGTSYHWRRQGHLWHFRRGEAAHSPTLTHRKSLLHPGVWLEEDTLADPAGRVLATSAVQYRRAPFGQVVEQRVQGSGSAAQCTRYFYGEQPGRADYGRLIRMLLPGGRELVYTHQ